MVAVIGNRQNVPPTSGVWNDFYRALGEYYGLASLPKKNVLLCTIKFNIIVTEITLVIWRTFAVHQKLEKLQARLELHRVVE